MKRFLSLFLVILLLVLPLCPVALADGGFTVDDGADLLTEEEEQALTERYAALNEFMPAALVTTASRGPSTEKFAESYAISHYGDKPAVIFVIDMYNRVIYLYSNGSALRSISKADARAITDNVYSYASRGNYYACAYRAFEQVLAKCRGARLQRPVKHITNALIAVLAAVLINYLLAVSSRRSGKQHNVNQESTASELLSMAIIPKLHVESKFLYRERVESSSSDSDSGSGGSRSSGGGSRSSGGSSHSGGGGGHRF